jgi:glycosyltransferase involved in cell wall biosynthesis
VAVRIQHIIARLNDGGPARVLRALCPLLQSRGITTQIITGTCAADEVDLSDDLRAQGIDVQVISSLGRRVSWSSDLRAGAALYHAIQRFSPTLVHTHTAKAGVLGRLWCQWLDLPCVHTYHGHVLSGYFSAPTVALLAAIERLCAKNSWQQALTDSDFHTLANEFHIGARQRWRVLPIPVTPVAPSAAAWHQQLIPECPVIGFIGRFAAVKDVYLWLETFARVQEKISVQGIMCGVGQERDNVMRIITERKLPIICPGHIPAGEAYAVMDVLLLTSHNEGLPVVAVEAMGITTRSVVVVAPPVGGLSSLIAAGVVCGAPRQAQALSAACADLLLHPATRAEFVARGRAFAEQLKPARLVEDYLSWYREISR